MEWLLLVLLAIVTFVAVVSISRARRAVAEADRVAKARAASLVMQKQLDRDLVVARNQLDGLGEAAMDALFILDENRRIVWANVAAWEMFSAEHRVPGQSFIALVHDAELNQAVVDALAGHRSIVRQTVTSDRTLRIRAIPVERTGGAAVAIEDVSELQRLGRARRDLIANISHELRTPLANIDLAAQTLRSNGSNDAELFQRMLLQVQSQVQTLSQLSQEMMDLAQIETGQVLLRMVPGSVEKVVRESLLALAPQYDLKRQDVRVLVPGDLMALMDEQHVIRVVGNLMSNAVRFTPEGGTIRVYAELSGEDDVTICVADTGPGIPEVEQPRIFERFYKQDRARSRGGTGLGLAIARHIVEGHGGRIWVESQPGQGAKFCFTLPRA